MAMRSVQRRQLIRCKGILWTKQWTFFFYCFDYFCRFGAKIISNQTGIILNDCMDGFGIPGVDNAYGIPASPANFIQPMKMPLSSMCPTILLDADDNVELLIGAAGGTRITSSVAYVSYHLLSLHHFHLLLASISFNCWPP